MKNFNAIEEFGMSHDFILITICATVNIIFLTLVAVYLLYYYKQNPLGLRDCFNIVAALIIYSVSFLGVISVKNDFLFGLSAKVMIATQMCLTTLSLFYFSNLSTKGYWVNKCRKIFLVMPISHIIITFTNDFHHLVMRHIDKAKSGVGYLIDYGPWFPIMRDYSLFILFLTAVVLMSGSPEDKRRTVKVMAYILVTFLVPGLISVMYNFGFFNISFNPLGTFLFIPAVMICYACFDYLGKARSKVVDFMGDMYFIFDLSGTCIDKNTKAENFIRTYFPEQKFDFSLAESITGTNDICLCNETEFSLYKDDCKKYFNATHFNISESASPLLGHGLLLREITAFKEQVDELNNAANIDTLTGAKNRRYFDFYASSLFKKVSSTTPFITLLMLDLDHFKKVNDTFGHSVGDEVLKAFCSICNENLRSNDIMFRIGGEEFVVTVDGANAETGEAAAERIRSAVAKATIETTKGPLSITVSIGGVSCRTNKDTNLAKLVELADKLLYKAKDGGRNKVEFINIDDLRL